MDSQVDKNTTFRKRKTKLNKLGYLHAGPVKTFHNAFYQTTHQSIHTAAQLKEIALPFNII